MSIKTFFSCLTFVLFSFLFLFNSSSIILAQSITPTASPSATATSSSTATPSANANQSFLDKLLSFLFGLFIKTDYSISSRDTKAINTDMTDYGDLSDSNFNSKHSFSGSRLTSSSSQNCLKGNVIKQTILATAGYSDSELAHICVDSANNCSVSSDTTCQLVKVSDLAHYFVQLKKQFYCDTNNKFINTESDITEKINKSFSTDIPANQLNCYQTIYNDFYITPKDNQDTNEENAKKIVQTPLSASSQDKTMDTKAIKDQVDQNFSPAGTDTGLNGLRPANW